MNPKIQMKPRHNLTLMPEEEKAREKDRLITRVLSKVIEFQDHSTEMSKEAKVILQNIAQCLEEYPEVQVLVEGHVTAHEGHRLGDQAMHISHTRAMLVGKMLRPVLLNEISCNGLGAAESVPVGCCRVRLSCVKLLDPQERIDMLLQKSSFGFERGTEKMGPQGRLLVIALAHVLQEVHTSVTLHIPRISTKLAMARSTRIAQAIKDTGSKARIVIRVATGKFDRAVLTIDKAGEVFNEDEEPVVDGAWDPQVKIADILRETPLAFKPNSSVLSPQVLPVIHKIAHVLKGVTDQICLVEAYSGLAKHGATTQKLKGIMQERAQHIVDNLYAEGVSLPCRPVGHAAAYSNLGSVCQGPCIVFDLMTEDEMLGVAEEDDEAVGGCIPAQGALGGLFCGSQAGGTAVHI